MDGQALVVGLEDRVQVLVQVQTGELEGLEWAEEAPDQDRNDGDEDVPTDESLFLLGYLITGAFYGSCHPAPPSSTTLTVPNMAACPMPQYSVQM